MSMKILVTGGAGYIGSVLCETLLAKGYEVTVLDNLMYNQNSLFHLLHNTNFNFVYGNVNNEKLLKDIVPKFDFILPLAAIVGANASEFDPYLTKRVNHEAIALLNKIRTKKQKIIFPTTNSGYGTKSGDVYCTEETPLEPISLYGETKVAAERELLSSGNAITLRFATCFGFSTRMRRDLLVNDFVYRAVNDGFVVLFEADFKRNYVHISDIVRAFLWVINSFETMKGGVYNVGLSKANLSKRELCEEIRKQVPRFVFFEDRVGRDLDQRNYIVSNAKIEKTGFKFFVSLSGGIRELIKGYQIIRRNQFSNV